MAATRSRCESCVCLVSSLILGCQDSPELPPVQIEGEFLAYAAADDVCPGTVVQAEQWMTAVAERLDIDPGQIRPTTYYLVDSDVTLAQCGSANAHCTRVEGDHIVVFSTDLLNKHELIHVLHRSAWPERQQILQEGLAHGFDDSFPDDNFAPPTQTLDAAIDDDALTGNSMVMAAGGFFVTWFYRRYGAERLEEFWHQTKHPTTPAEFRADFQQVVGEALEQVFPETNTAGCRVVTCPGVPRPWVDGAWTTTSPDGCEDDTVVGSVGVDSYHVLRTDLMEITVGGQYEIAVSAGAAPGAAITNCDSPCPALGIESGATQTHYLEPGMYRVETTQWERHAPTYSVTVTPLDP